MLCHVVYSILCYATAYSSDACLLLTIPKTDHHSPLKPAGRRLASAHAFLQRLRIAVLQLHRSLHRHGNRVVWISRPVTGSLLSQV